MFKKTFVMTLVILFTFVVLLLPASEVLAGCSDTAAKTAISSILALGGLAALDCMATGCTLTLLWLSIAQGIPFATLAACLYALISGN